MYILIEHDGTKEGTEQASLIKNIAEDEFGYTCDFAISNNKDVSLYDEESKELIKLKVPSSSEEINFVLNFINEEE